MLENVAALGPLVCGIALLAPIGRLQAQENAGEERMQWWSDQKFGMFIHYGPWCHHSDEHKTKSQKTRAEAEGSFNPANDAAEQWAKLAKEAGMRYVVLTTKHTSSFDFPLWRTKTTDYGITFPDCPYSKQPDPDLVDQYVKAMRKAGLGIGLYYPWDDMAHPDGRWFSGHPDRHIPGFVQKYPERWANFVKFEKEQLRELLTQYGPIDIFWFDGSYEDRSEDALPILKMMRELQPDLIIDNRGTLNHADIVATYESCIPRTATTGYWETCMGLCGKGGWVVPRQGDVNKEWMTIGNGWYDYQGPDMEYKSIKDLIQALCTIASKGGNLLLNVGPRPDGTIPEPEVELLRQMGKWLRENGEAIYGASKSPFAGTPEWGRITRKGQKIYLLIFDWPERSGILPLDIGNSIKSAKLLATGEDVAFKRINSTTVEIRLPEVSAAWEPHIQAVRKAPNEYASVVVLDVEGDMQP